MDDKVIGRIVDSGIGEFEGQPIFSLTFEYEQDGKTHALTGNLFFFKKDGSVNENMQRDLMSICGWDGSDLKALNDGIANGKPCQAVIEDKEANGKTYRNIKFINAIGGRGVKRSNESELTTIQAKFGSKLRATAGAPAKPRAEAKPAMPGVTATQPDDLFPYPAVAKVEPETVWEQFVGTVKLTGQALTDAFLDFVNAGCGTRTTGNVPPEGWSKLAANLTHYVSIKLKSSIPF